MKIPDNVTNPKTRRKWERMQQEENERAEIASKLGYKPVTSLKAGSNSSYSYVGGEGLAFDTKWDAREHFIKETLKKY